MHELSELNQYTGLFSILCFLALFFCFRSIGLVCSAVHRFHMDYRKVNRLDERDAAEWAE